MAEVTITLLPAALAKEQAAPFLSLSESTFEKLVREGSLPKPRQLADRRVAWVRSELEAWLLQRPHSQQLPPPNPGAPKRRSEPPA